MRQAWVKRLVPLFSCRKCRRYQLLLSLGPCGCQGDVLGAS